MRVLIRSVILPLTLLASLLALVSGGNTEAQGDRKADQKNPSEITLETVKPKKFNEAIQSHKGKVVVVDVWATFCAPCMKEFPNLVRLHEKYGKDGLVCVSCSVDETQEHERALKFLKKSKATFPNYRLDFKENKEWQDHFGINGPPTIFVYSRDGKLAKQFVVEPTDPKSSFTYEDVEKLVVELLPAGKK